MTDAAEDRAARDTTDLRTGPPIHDALLALLPLVGSWRGAGGGVVPSSGKSFRYEQHATFAHDGRPFLTYESRTWLVDENGAVIRPALRESGFWRPGAGPDDVEAQLAAITGLAMTYAGTAGDLAWELRTTAIIRTPTASEVDGERRIYALVGDALSYATELALPGRDYAPHLNGRLERG